MTPSVSHSWAIHVAPGAVHEYVSTPREQLPVEEVAAVRDVPAVVRVDCRHGKERERHEAEEHNANRREARRRDPPGPSRARLLACIDTAGPATGAPEPNESAGQ